MSVIENSPPNSIWPNGLKKDSEGYAIFYPLGTNKVNIEDCTWPTGDKLISPFVYQDNKLVGFCDSKALEGNTFDIPYKHTIIKLCGNPININLQDNCDTFTITLTKATTGPIINKEGLNEVPADYALTAPEMTSAIGMFAGRKVKSIKLYIPKLTDGTDMFNGCELTSEQIYEILNSLPMGTGENNINIGLIPEDVIETDLIAAFAEKGWNITKVELEYENIIGETTYERTFTELQQKLLNDTVKIVNNECFDADGKKIGIFEVDKLKDTTNISEIVIGDNEPVMLTDDGKEPINPVPALAKLNHIESDMSSLEDGTGFLSMRAFEDNGENLFFKGDLSNLKKHNIKFEIPWERMEVPEGGLTEEDIAEMYIFSILYKFGIFNFIRNLHFESNLSSLEDGNDMFALSNVTHFNADLSSLKKARGMFSNVLAMDGNINEMDINLNQLKTFLLLPNPNESESRFALAFVTCLAGSPATYALTKMNEEEETFNGTVWDYAKSKGLVSSPSFFNSENLIKMTLEIPSFINYESFINLSENINDLSSKNITYDIKTGEGYIDISLFDELNNINETEFNETFKKFTDKGWRCKVYLLSLDENNEIKIETKSNYNDTTTDTESDVSPYLIDHLSEIDELLSGIDLIKYENGYFYNAETDELIGQYDLSIIEDANTYYYTGGKDYSFERLVSFKGDMTKLKCGSFMFNSSLGETLECTMTSFEGDLSSMEYANLMFAGRNLSSFKSNLSSLIIGNYMFNGCKLDEESLKNISSTINNIKNDGNYHEICIGDSTNLTSEIRNEFINKGWFVTDSDYNILCNGHLTVEEDAILKDTITIIDNSCYNINGDKIGEINPISSNNGYKFYYNENLTSFNGNLSNVYNGQYMFCECSSLTSFASDLSSFTRGTFMFCNCSSLTSFDRDLSSLTDGDYMFDGCTNLTTFTSNLSNLTNGTQMFDGCTKLTSFTSDLSSLNDANGMFSGCKLDTASLQNIAETINSSPPAAARIDIRIGNSTPNDEEIAAFDTIASKGWNIYVNGSQYTPSSAAAIATLDENGEEVETPIPYYAKPVEVPAFEAKYVGEDGKYYNIVGAQFIYGDDLSTYGMFTCEEDAALNMRLTKIDENTKLKLNLSDLSKMPTLSTTGSEKINMDNIKEKAKELMTKLKK